MPKKKNAFMMFADEFREEQKRKGITYQNTQELVVAASSGWDKLSESARSKYKESSKSLIKYTSTGIPYEEIDRKRSEERKAEQLELKEIKNLIELGMLNGTLNNQDFYLMDVNYFCMTTKGFVICESTIIRFCLDDGIVDYYHEMVNPGAIPTGYASDAMQESKRLGIEVPFDDKSSDYLKILANIIEYLRIKNQHSNTLPPIFTMPNKVAPVQDFIQQMCYMAGQDETMFRVYKLPQLFYQLANAIKKSTDEGFPKESLALDGLNTQRFLLLRGQACEHHEPIDKHLICTMSQTKSWAYIILDHCCPLMGIDLVLGKHLPPDLDIEKIGECKEDMQSCPRETVAWLRGWNESSASSTVSNAYKSSVEERQPVRKPKEDFLKSLKISLNLNNDQPANAAGRGRGRPTTNTFLTPGLEGASQGMSAGRGWKRDAK